jgi:2-polyprenyl-3-methyl-5-hydroxy-6-metoxy-1,4-benzoquinol methylase
MEELATVQYPRESIERGETDALARIAAMIADDSRVLDLGTARGPLGRALRARDCVVDGVERDPTSAEVARPHYRTLHIADLEQSDLEALFPGRTYDVVVCADLLEHLRSPDRLLAAIPALLRPRGELLVSVPNVGYTGVVLELLFGRFEYRPRGLLDRTHVRFFTRESMVDLLEQAGFGVQSVEPLQVPLEQSEFTSLHPERVEPALLAALCRRPDGRAYQFLLRAVPGSTSAPGIRVPLEASAVGFNTQLYWRGPGEAFEEVRSRSLSRSYGETRHRVTFPLPPGCTGLRWDPLDRPGLVSVHRLELVDGGGTRLWSSEGTELLASPGSSGVRWVVPTPPITLLALDADPWLELPVPALLAGAGPAELSIEFSVFPSQEAFRTADALREAEDRAARAQAQVAELLAEVGRRVSALEAESKRAAEERRAVRDALGMLQGNVERAVADLGQLCRGVEHLRSAQAAQGERIEELHEAQAAGLEAWARRAAGRALRSAARLGTRELLEPLKVRPMKDVERTEVGFRATGADPQVELRPMGGRLPEGRVALRYRLECDVAQASLYLDVGSGYSEGHRFPLPPAGTEILLTLPPGTRRLRLDPRESAGEFLLTDVVLVKLPSREPWAARLRRSLGPR